MTKKQLESKIAEFEKRLLRVEGRDAKKPKQRETDVSEMAMLKAQLAAVKDKAERMITSN